MPPASFNAATTAAQAAKHFAAQIVGKTVLITGGTPKGLGAEAARVIAQHDPKLIILAGRTQSNLDAATSSILAETPSAKLQTLLVDFASLSSVRSAASLVNAYTFPIDVLILNHGIMAAPYSVTEDGFESHFAINHLGPFLFTNLIKPRILASQDPRVVVVSSLGHRRMNVRFEDPGFKGGEEYSPMEGYGQSKTANIQFAVGLAERWKGVTSCSLHPGGIQGTNLSRFMTHEDQIRLGFLTADGKPNTDKYSFKTLEEGAATHIVAAFDPEIQNSNGAYLADCQIGTPSAYAVDKGDAQKLWALSEKMVGEAFV
ncbi:NAD(P)-binding protein [Pseudohyphozyma bogoriensis]|nr:NAD(P)-binding protein [Pseudohyphozyma bogoriensis]